MPQVGFAERDITPKLGTPSPGGFVPTPVDRVHDPLKAVAMVVSEGGKAVALVGIDALFIDADTTAMIRERVFRETKIPGEAILVGASHTHSGGALTACFGTKKDPEYAALVAERVAEAVVAAWNAMHDAEIGVGVGHEPSVSFNRRFLMRDGSVVTHPGKGNPDIVAPEGPIDPDVGVLVARAPGGEILGLFVNFACHLTIGNGPGFSADYVYQLREALRAHYGRADLPVGFLQGSSGDVTQVDNRRPGREFGPAWCEIVGRALAAEVAQATSRVEWTKSTTLAAARLVTPIPMRDLDADPRPTPTIGLGSGSDDVFNRERETLRALKAASPIVEAESQAIRIGDLTIATTGAELFCKIGLDIKAASAARRTWVVSLANDNIGYVPTPSAFYAGGYEPRTAQTSKLVPWAGQLVTAGALKAIAALK